MRLENNISCECGKPIVIIIICFLKSLQIFDNKVLSTPPEKAYGNFIYIFY